MRALLVAVILLVVVLAGCGGGPARTAAGLTPAVPPNTATPLSEVVTAAPAPTGAEAPALTATVRTLQLQINAVLLEATIVMATVAALNTGPPTEPAVATAVAQRYQDNIATIEAVAPTPDELDALVQAFGEAL